MKYGEVKGLVRRHLLNEAGDIFSKPTDISLCFDDSRLEWNGSIEVCLVFYIWSKSSVIIQEKRIDDREFEGTLFCTDAMIGIELTECFRTPRKREAVFSSEINHRAGVDICCHDVTSSYERTTQITTACLKRISACGKRPVYDRTYGSTAQCLIGPIAILIQIGNPEREVGIWSAIPLQSVRENELYRFSWSNSAPIGIVFATSESGFREECAGRSNLIEYP